MATVIIALGSNKGDRSEEIAQARSFLSNLSDSKPRHAPIYETEPIGPSDTYYYNTVTEITTSDSPHVLVEKLKAYEQKRGRSKDDPRWSARCIDLDIIAYDDRIINENGLRIPHKEYYKRLFVLKPLQDIRPGWRDPENHTTIKELISKVPEMEITPLKTN